MPSLDQSIVTLRAPRMHRFTSQVMGSLDAHTGSVECIVFAEALSFGVTAGLDGKVIIWDMQARKKHCLRPSR